MFPPDEKEIQFAIQAVHRAALLVSQIQAELARPQAQAGAEASDATAAAFASQALTKADASPVTVADFASQALIAHLLAETFPEDPIVAEEDTSALQDENQHTTLSKVAGYVERYAPGANEKSVASWIDVNRADRAPRFWTIDPIDGTKGFLRGEQYAVALALVESGEVQVGVLGCPNLTDASHPEKNGPGSLVVAARNQGAWVTSLQMPGEYRPLHVSDITQPEQARILRSYEAGHTNISQIDRFSQALGVQAEPVRMDSQAKYAVLAAGHGEIMLRLLSASQPDYKEKIWDQAAGALILTEAGGRITDLRGQPLDFTHGRMLAANRGVLASNGALHEAALRILERIEA